MDQHPFASPGTPVRPLYRKWLGAYGISGLAYTLGWLVVWAAVAVQSQTAWEISRDLPRRFPLVVSLPEAAAPEQIEALKNYYDDAGAAYEFVTKAEGLERLRMRLPAADDVLSDLPVNPIPDRFFVRLGNPEEYGRVEEQIAQILPGASVYSAIPNLSRRKLDTLTTLATIFITASSLLLVVLGVIALADRLKRKDILSDETPRPTRAAAGALVLWTCLGVSLLMGVAAALIARAALDAAPQAGTGPVSELSRLIDLFTNYVSLDLAFWLKYLAGSFLLMGAAALLAVKRTAPPENAYFRDDE